MFNNLRDEGSKRGGTPGEDGGLKVQWRPRVLSGSLGMNHFGTVFQSRLF